MTNYRNVKNLNKKELAKFLCNICSPESNLWIKWFDDTFCKKCEPIISKKENELISQESAYCEINDKCKYFKDKYKEVPSLEEICEMWLSKKVE